MSARRAARLLWVALLLVPAALLAHGALRRAEPAAGARLTVAPTFIRLTFSERVELAVARLTLTGPDGRAVALAPLRHGDSATVIAADVTGPLEAGAYAVAWQVVGRDGHPVRGRYAFTIAPGAAGLAALPDDTTLAAAGTAPASPPAPDSSARIPRAAGQGEPAGRVFDAQSPLFAGVRWLNFVGMLALIGTVGFRLLVVPGSQRRGAPAALAHDADRGTRRLGVAAAMLLLAATLLRLAAQSVAMDGGVAAPDGRLVGAMVTSTLWGAAWLLQVGAALAAVVGLVAVRRAPRAGWAIVAAATLPIALAAALSGHGAAVPDRTALAVAADTAHVLGAGGWVGTLLLLVAVGLPAARRLGAGERGPAVAAMVSAFSPLALVFATTAALTGVGSAWLHLGAVDALWTTPYGRTLLVKLGALSLLVAMGAYNWLRVKPALGDEPGARRMGRSATVELAVGAVVLAVTAVLVATPTPLDAP